jgi:hypothetical protein
MVSSYVTQKHRSYDFSLTRAQLVKAENVAKSSLHLRKFTGDLWDQSTHARVPDLLRENRNIKTIQRLALICVA